MLKGIITVALTTICIMGFAYEPPMNEESQDRLLGLELQLKLAKAVKADVPATAAQWAQALASYRAAQAMEAQAHCTRRADRVLSGYENILGSAPGMFKALKALKGGQDSKFDKGLAIAEYFLKAWEAPQGEESAEKLIRALDKAEQE